MKVGFLSRALFMRARALLSAFMRCSALVFVSVPAAAQVVIGGTGLPPVEVNMSALDALSRSTGAALLQLPGVSPAAPVQLRPPGADDAAPTLVMEPMPMPMPMPMPALVLAPPADSGPASAADPDMPEAPAAAEVPPLAGTSRPLPPAQALAPAEPQLADLGASAFPEGTVSVVHFSGVETELSPTARDQLQQLAVQLASTERRVQLNAFAGGSDETVSAARRLSLSRALAVRAYLIERGVRSARIDVRALGAPEDNGPAERVDILLLAQ
jgi:outer membrane protein OmpA-like peptidoglycan-associated protein